MRLWKFIKRLFSKEKPTPVSVTENPAPWRGSKWITLRPTSSGPYIEVWYEISRNKAGLVTLVPPYGWDEQSGQLKNHGHWLSIERNLPELLDENQAHQKLMDHPDLHPATTIMLGGIR